MHFVQKKCNKFLNNTLKTQFYKIFNKYLVNTLIQLKNTFCLYFQKYCATNKKFNDTTQYVWSNKFTPAKIILHTDGCNIDKV